MRYDLVTFTCSATLIAPTLNDLHHKFGAVVVTCVEVEEQKSAILGQPSAYACTFLVSIPDDPAAAGVQPTSPPETTPIE